MNSFLSHVLVGYCEFFLISHELFVRGLNAFRREVIENPVGASGKVGYGFPVTHSIEVDMFAETTGELCFTET